MNELTNKRIVIVGLFAFLGLVFLIVCILMVGNLHKTFEKKLELVSFFENVAGLQKGDNVWFSGVKVGTVDEIAFYEKSRVKVRILIDIKAKQYIPNDAKVKIGSPGFIGNKILVIFGGSHGAKNVENGDTLLVEKTLSSEDILKTLQENNKNMLAITSDFKTLSKKLVAGEGTIGKLLNDDAVYANIATATTALQGVLQKAQELTHTLAAFSINLTKEGTLAHELATDTTVFKSVKASVLQLQQMADTASVFIANLKQNGNNPDSPLGILLQNKESGTSLKETIKNLEQSSEKLAEDLEAVQHSWPFKKYFKKKAKNQNSDSMEK